MGGRSPIPEGGEGSNQDAAVADDAAGQARRRAGLGAMMLMSVIASFQFGAILQHETFRSGFSAVVFSMTDEEKSRHEDLARIVEQIPRGAMVAATEHLAPHVSTRSSLYCFRSSIGKADWILVGPVDKASKVRETVSKLLTEEKAGVVAEEGDFFVLRLGADPSKNAEALKKMKIPATQPKAAKPKPKTPPKKPTPTAPPATPPDLPPRRQPTGLGGAGPTP
jgi:hypothetical protein